MPFVDGLGNHFFTIERPCVCEPLPCWPLCFCFAQKLDIKDRHGMTIARAEEPPASCGCCKSCCTRSYHTYDSAGNAVYVLKASACCTERGNNCCAPTCCNQSYEVDVYLPSGEYVNSSTFVWPGCNCGGMLDMTNLFIQFPQGSTDESRAALLAGMMLVEYTVQELKRLHDRQRRNQNQSYAGGDGGAPVSAQMER